MVASRFCPKVLSVFADLFYNSRSIHCAWSCFHHGFLIRGKLWWINGLFCCWKVADYVNCNSLKQVPAVHIPPVTLTQSDHIQLSSWTLSHSFAILKGIRDSISWISTAIYEAVLQLIMIIGLSRRGSLILSITSMITDRIGRLEVLLPINQNYNRMWERNYTSVIRFH